MRPKRIKIAVVEDAEITVRDVGGKLGLWLVGPGWVAIEMRKKRKPKIAKR
jgi:hypothetical protein